MEQPTATGRVEITADPHRVYELVSDPGVLAELAEEYAGHEWLDGAESAAVGARFRGRNRRGLRRWSTVSTITHADPGVRFAFQVRVLGTLLVSEWSYAIRPTSGGCEVVEATRDRRPAWFRLPSELITGVFDRAEENRRNIDTTLRRLKELAEREPS